MRRFEDWPERLIAYIDAEAASSFRWGITDCAFFAANGVLAMTGRDFLAAYRRRPGGPGRYTTKRGAAMALKRRDGTLRAGMERRFGAAVGWTRARRGDVVLMETDEAFGEALGLCLGRQSAFRDPREGLVFVDTCEVSAAWAVGD